MKRKVLIFLLNILLCGTFSFAQGSEKSSLQQRADDEMARNHGANARSLYILAFDDYVNKGQVKAGVDCGVKATELYYKENSYKEAFELLRRIDQAIANDHQSDQAKKSAMRYYTSKERMLMYMRMHRSASAEEHLNNMEHHAEASHDDDVENDLLYNKTIYYYTFGQTTKGNATFKEMSARLTNVKDYDRLDGVYQTLISMGRKAGNAYMVDQSYSTYMVWKDSVTAVKHAEEVAALNQQIEEGKKTIAERDSSLSSRQTVIIGLCILAAILAAALVLGAIVLLRFIMLTRKQKKTIDHANESNALKAKFIKNISAQLNPTLRKLDVKKPEVKALVDFSDHIQTLSELDTTPINPEDVEEVQVQSLCESLMDRMQDKFKNGVTVRCEVPKMTVKIHKPFVEHILLHLLENANEYVSEDGHIILDFKKRGAHKHQFLVSNTGEPIPEEKREDIFKPFLEVKDLTTGDGLGLPICKQMALKMDGDLEIDPSFTKGTRFLLNLQA